MTSGGSVFGRHRLHIVTTEELLFRETFPRLATLVLLLLLFYLDVKRTKLPSALTCR